MNLYFNPLTAQLEFYEKDNTRGIYSNGITDAFTPDVSYIRKDHAWLEFITADGVVVVPSYERHIQVQAIPSGTVASQATGNTVGTAVGLQFASTPDKYAGFQWEVPDDWAGDNVKVEIDWLCGAGSMSGTDTIQWVLEYRSIAEGELVTQGTLATVTVTNNDDNAQYLTIHSPFTIAYNHANQPLVKQDHVYFLIHRNTAVANDFAGTVTVMAFEIVYNSVSLPTS